MNLNDNMILEIAQQLGLSENPGISTGDLRRMEGKSDEELKQEIMRIRDQLAAKGIPYGRQVTLLKNMMSMMDNKQRARLQKVIELIEK